MGFGIDVSSGQTGGFTTYVELDPVALAALLRSPDGLVARDIIRRGTQVKRAAQRRVGVRTGRLRDSIVTRNVLRSGEFTVQVGSAVPYAEAHHEGTEAHTIYPRRARLLAFKWPGAPATDRRGRPMKPSRRGLYVFRHVSHPGTSPNPYLRDALRDVIP